VRLSMTLYDYVWRSRGRAQERGHVARIGRVSIVGSVWRMYNVYIYMSYIDHTAERREFREGGSRALGQCPVCLCGHVDTGYVG
jgi:hypothetical protein